MSSLIRYSAAARATQLPLKPSAPIDHPTCSACRLSISSTRCTIPTLVPRSFNAPFRSKTLDLRGRRFVSFLFCSVLFCFVSFYLKQRCYTQPSLMSVFVFAPAISRFIFKFFYFLAPGTCGRYSLSKLLCEYVCVDVPYAFQRFISYLSGCVLLGRLEMCR